MSQTLGAVTDLQLVIPEAGERDWDVSIRDNCFQKIVDHDHTGASGLGKQLTSAAFADDAITFAKINGANDSYLTARNNADSADINIIKVNTSDTLTLGATLASPTITSATLSSPVLTTPEINDTSSDHQYIFAVSELAADRTITLPLLTGNDEFVFKDHTQTLTNKTLTTPVIASISNSGTITVPSGTDTLVARDTTDTLTNKSIDSDNNTITNIVNADIKAAAAIDVNKLAAVTADRALVSDGSGFLSAASTTAAEIGYVSGVTSAIQTQIDSKLPTTITTTGDIIYSSSGSTASRLGIGSAGQVLTVAAGIPSWATNTVSPVAPTSKTTTYTALTTDDTILADTSGGAWTLTLYAASGNGGRRLRVVKTTSDTTALTIDGNAAETINGSTTYTINIQYQEVTLLCDGTNWNIESEYVPVVAADGYRGSTQSINNASVTKINIDTEGEGDTHNSLDLTTDYDFTAPVTGWYHITGQIHWASNGTGTRLTLIYKNGGELFRCSNPSTVDDFSHAVKTVKLNAGDTIEMRGYQTSGGALNAQSGQGRTYLNIIRLGF